MKKLFSKYLQSVCSPDEFQEITQWISKIEKEQTLTSQMKSNWDQVLKQESDHPINPVLWHKIRLAIEEEEKAELHHRLRIYTWGLRVASVLLITLAASYFYFSFDLKKPDHFVQTQTVSVPFGARTNFLLPDGSRVWVNAGSEVTYNSDFVSQRTVSLKGEAYFEVIKSDHPFFVRTNLAEVKVTGTAFNVKSLDAENRFEVTVEKGSVVVPAGSEAQHFSLTEGCQARLLDGKWDYSKVETDLYTSWKEGKIIFRRAYLPEVVQRLEHWYNVTIEMADDKRLAKIHYTGTLEMESFSEVLELLKVTAPINYSYNDKTRVIRITHR